jgi:type I restriction enzyme S subunit
MNTAVPLITIRELIERGEANVQTGPFGTQLKASEYVESGTPVINVRNVGFGDIRDADLEFINEAKAEQLKAHKLQRGDIVFGRKGAVERHALIADDQDGWIQGSDCLRLRLESETVCERYASYYLRTRAHQDWMQALCSFGATMASLNQDIVKRITIPLPDFPTQRKIAAILTAYDDLIEVNKRGIALLEKMAEELYREWFVRMRFPGHQNTKFVKGVPAGWKLRKIENAFEFTGGGTPSKSLPNYWNDGNVNWFTPSDITGASGIFLTESKELCSEEGLARSSAKMFPAYSVMMTSRATIGAIGINTSPACTNQGFITCIPNEQYPLPYLYQWLKLAKPYFEQLCGGATFPELTKGTFKKIEILTPPLAITCEFSTLSNPLLESIEASLEANKILTRTRDLLLPRLISGKLSVEDLDIQFPPSMR